MRVLLLLKGVKRNISKVLRPKRVEVIRINGKTVDETILSNTNAFFAAYMMIIVASFLLVSLDGLSLTASFSAVLACLNNIGPGLSELGPVSNFSSLGACSKLVLIFDMLAGRLEIFPILILFHFKGWKRG